jgi:hypothetical protein
MPNVKLLLYNKGVLVVLQLACFFAPGRSDGHAVSPTPSLSLPLLPVDNSKNRTEHDIFHLRFDSCIEYYEYIYTGSYVWGPVLIIGLSLRSSLRT